MNDLAAYEPYFQVIEQDLILGDDPVVGISDTDQRRLIIIEYTNDPPAVTPFRGEVKAPSIEEADLF